MTSLTSQVALAWLAERQGVNSTLVGVSKVAQLRENIGSLKIRFSAALLAELNQVSAPAQRMLYSLFTQKVRQQVVFVGHAVLSRSESI